MKHDPAQLHRRRFLQVSAAAAACSLAVPPSAAAASSANPLIDTHVYLGHWPLRQLSADTPSKLAAQLRRAGVTQAWAGTFDGLFHKDIHGANLRLIAACRKFGDGLLVPIGSVNPTLPDWEEDVRRCHELFKMPGIRLHPTYHGYTLDDPRFARLLELAAARGLFVQLVAEIVHMPRRLLTPRTPRVDLVPLAKILQSFRGLQLLIAILAPTQMEIVAVLRDQTSACFEFAGITDVETLQQTFNRIPAERIVYGSIAPLHDVALRQSTLQHTNWPANQLKAVRGGNAERLLNKREAR